MNLKDIHSPDGLKNCSDRELQVLAAEIRRHIIDTVQQNGGHLASNLGVVELTMALHRVLDCPRDKILFDVGHQCYPHKLLTGRADAFSGLRKTDGLSGFPCREESPYDCFADGHASTAISAALGMARARDMMGEDYRIAVVVGDGALTGGMCYEALNDLGQMQTPLLIVLNDNEMSIDKNVGALSQHLTRLRVGRGWLGAKKVVAEGLGRIPGVGDNLSRTFRRAKNHVRNLFVKDHFFSSLGIRYFGPIDGHDLREMERVFRQVRDMEEPVVVHVVTKKGKGLEAAEKMPECYHGIAPRGAAVVPSYGAVAGEYLTQLAGQNREICVVTAAMTDSAGFKSFRLNYPQRLFDVGIAEEHAVTLAAGLAAGGMRPVVAVYETFMQRGVDQMLMDVCLQKLPVIFLMDRSGLGADDGPTHHGVFGLPLMQSMPGLKIWSPRCSEELVHMLDGALQETSPVAILYPRAQETRGPAWKAGPHGKWEMLRQGKDGHILTFSAMVSVAVAAAEKLRSMGMDVGVVNASSLSPLDEEMLGALAGSPLYTLEESMLAGGFGSRVAQVCIEKGWPVPCQMMGIGQRFVPFGSREDWLCRLGLDADTVARRIWEDKKH